MFDTLHMYTETEINPYLLDQYKAKDSFTYLDNNKNEITKHELKIESIYIKYFMPATKLVIETSIAKVINNNQNNLISSTFEPEKFWNNLNSILYKYLQITVPNDNWIVYRLDVTHDIKTKKIEQAVEKLSKLQIKNYNTNLHNQNESITFFNRTSSICIYDKEKQYKTKKESDINIKNAKNILRIEIRPAPYARDQYDSQKKAVNLITKEYAEYIAEKYCLADILTKIKKRNRAKNPVLLTSSNIKNIETAAGFNYLIDMYGEKAVKESMTPGTFKNRRKLLKSIKI